MKCGICGKEIIPLTLNTPQAMFEWDVDISHKPTYCREALFCCCDYTWVVCDDTSVQMYPAFNKQAKLVNPSLLNYIQCRFRWISFIRNFTN